MYKLNFTFDQLQGERDYRIYMHDSCTEATPLQTRLYRIEKREYDSQ